MLVHPIVKLFWICHWSGSIESNLHRETAVFPKKILFFGIWFWKKDLEFQKCYKKILLVSFSFQCFPLQEFSHVVLPSVLGMLCLLLSFSFCASFPPWQDYNNFEALLAVVIRSRKSPVSSFLFKNTNGSEVTGRWLIMFVRISWREKLCLQA